MFMEHKNNYLFTGLDIFKKRAKCFEIEDFVSIVTYKVDNYQSSINLLKDIFQSQLSY